MEAAVLLQAKQGPRWRPCQVLLLVPIMALVNVLAGLGLYELVLLKLLNLTIVKFVAPDDFEQHIKLFPEILVGDQEILADVCEHFEGVRRRVLCEEALEDQVVVRVHHLLVLRPASLAARLLEVLELSLVHLDCNFE